MRTIVVVDVQNGFIEPEYIDLPKKIREHILGTHYDHILFGAFINKEGSNFVSLLGWKKLFDPPETEIVPELTDLVVSGHIFFRSAYSLFKSDSFRNYLEQHNVIQFDLCGLVADSCVLATAYEGFDLGYEVAVLRDLMRTKQNLEDPTEEIFKRNIDRQV